MTLWTPSGEHPVDRPRPAPGGDAGAGAPPGGDQPGSPGGDGSHEPLTPEEAQLDELRRQLAEAPADVVIANHAYGLFELAAVYLSQQPPLLPQAQLAIDAMAAIVEGLKDRLGEAEPSLRQALAQVRVAFVELNSTEEARAQTPGNGASSD
jgi:hypothetical protein